MTWNASSGNPPSSEERSLIVESVMNMLDLMIDEEEGEFNYSGGPFDSLTTPEKCSVLLDVLQALFEPTDEVPELTAINESAIYFIFQWIQQSFNDDVETGEAIYGRKILEALGEAGLGVEEEDDAHEYYASLPTLGCLDAAKWNNTIESLADRILWDRDFEMADEFLAMPPNMMATIMELAGIDEMYFQPYVGRAKPNAMHTLLLKYAAADLNEDTNTAAGVTAAVQEFAVGTTTSSTDTGRLMAVKRPQNEARFGSSTSDRGTNGHSGSSTCNDGNLDSNSMHGGSAMGSGSDDPGPASRAGPCHALQRRGGPPQVAPASCRPLMSAPTGLLAQQQRGKPRGVMRAVSHGPVMRAAAGAHGRWLR